MVAMFQLTLRLKARPREVAELVRALRQIVIAAQTERGFVGSRIYEDVVDHLLIYLQEDWANESVLQSHIRSSSFTELLMLMETTPEVPVLEVRWVREVYGLEYVEAVRFGGN
jgi:quinol monooxygenase YgiN